VDNKILIALHVQQAKFYNQESVKILVMMDFIMINKFVKLVTLDVQDVLLVLIMIVNHVILHNMFYILQLVLLHVLYHIMLIAITFAKPVTPHV